MASSDALVVDNVSKAFGGTKALDQVSVTVKLGEVHALLGHNGSGKSTLIKIISGYHNPDSGSVTINGHQVHYPTTSLALREFGVSFLHQDIGLVPTLSILENLRVGRLDTGALGHIRWRNERATVSELLARFGIELNPELPVSRLSAAQRSILGVIRAFQDVEGDNSLDKGGLIILDEPTAALPEAEKEILFGAIKLVASHGVGVLLVTHHLEEPLQYANRVSVLRDGKLIVTDDVAAYDYDSLAELVVGQSVDKVTNASGGKVRSDQSYLKVDGLTSENLDGVSFEAFSGEIIGLTGLMGAGHEEVPFLLYGATTPKRGEIVVNGRKFRPDPVNSRREGISLVSGDRLRAGGVLSASIGENVTLPVLDTIVGRLGWLRGEKEESIVSGMMSKFAIRGASAHMPFSVLSGGNQQKALVGRWIEAKPKILLLQEPTAGVDIGATVEIIRMLKAFAEQGGIVIFSSEQYEDVATLSDRVLVFRSGRIICELSGSNLTPTSLVDASYGKIEV